MTSLTRVTLDPDVMVFPWHGRDKKSDCSVPSADSAITTRINDQVLYTAKQLNPGAIDEIWMKARR